MLLPPSTARRQLATFGGQVTPAAGTPCPGPFDVCPGTGSKCVNPLANNEWCFWLYKNKAPCVCT